MEEERWPREELRAVKNNNASKWSKIVARALEKVGDGESIEKFLVDEERTRLRENMVKGIIIKQEQIIQGNWGKIKEAKYCKDYKDWQKKIRMERYWDIAKVRGKDKEQ